MAQKQGEQHNLFTIKAIATGNTTVTVTVTDGAATDEESITVEVTGNVAPAITRLVDQMIETNTTKTVNFIVMDENAELGDTVTVTADETGVAAGAEILTIGTVMPRPGVNNGYSVDILGKMGGQTTLTVTAKDSANNEVEQSIRVRVNTPPQIVAVSPEMISLLNTGTPSTRSVVVRVTDADVEDRLTITLTSNFPLKSQNVETVVPITGNAVRLPQSFTLSARGESFSTGTAIVTMRVSDGVATDERQIEVTVTENVAPAITGLDNQTIEPNTTKTVSFTVMDENAELGDTVTVTADETGVAAGAEILNIGTVVPRPGVNNGYSVDILGKVAGQTTLTVTATDSAGNKDTQEARVTIESTGIRIRARVFLEGPLR